MRIRRFAALALALALALFAGLPGAAPAFADQSVPTPGVDYSWFRPTQDQLSGVPVVVRYLVPKSWGSGKALTTSEARWLLGIGKVVVLNYEWAANSPNGGRANGVRDAQYAELARVEVGAPPLRIYFSADWDVQPWEVPNVLAYLDGAASVLGKQRVGLYGSYRAVSAALDVGYAGWQTYAWSHGVWDARAALRQTLNGAYWNGEGDRDEVWADPAGWSVDPFLPGPGDSIRPRPVPPAPAPAPAFYLVQSGDTLTLIAQRFGTTWQQLAAINHLANPNVIYVGQKLWLAGQGVPVPAPLPPAGGGVYVVRAGDTLSRIAAAVGTTWQTLAAINHLANPNLIYVGERIALPGGGGAPPPVGGSYVVRAGDTLSGIAARNGTTWQRLATINRLGNPNLIYVGERLRLS